MTSSLRVLCISTNGIMGDGITAWMKSTFGAMDLSQLDVVTTAFVGCDEEVVGAVEAAGLTVERVPGRKKDPLGYMRAYKTLLRNGSFNVVHVCCNSAMAAFELVEAKRRHVGMRIAHSHNTMCSHRVASTLLSPLFQASVTDRYACGTAAGRWLFGDRPFTVVPNGKDLSAYAYSQRERAVVRKELGLAEDDVAFGHVGGFNKQKNHLQLIDCFLELYRRDSSRRLFLIGEGDLRGAAKEKVDALGVERAVRFLGRRDDVPRLLNAMDCMIFPSLYEGFPNVVLEWQLNGLPVVMSDTITDECAITPLVSQMPLSATSAEWADAAERSMCGRDRAADSNAACEAAKAGGYDIAENAAMLRRLYLEGVGRCG